MDPAKSFFFLLLLRPNFGQTDDLIQSLQKVINFTEKHYEEMNLDGLLGFVIAESQILQALEATSDYQTREILENFLQKCEKLRQQIIPNLPKTPPKMLFLEKYLLHPESWITGENFQNNLLKKLGIYSNWTADNIINNKHAWYKGIPSDFCLMEILKQKCYIGPFCKEMMLAPRVDQGYLLSHRLFYLQIIRLKQCHYKEKIFRFYTRNFCSLMLKELLTNEYLDFPAYDIALEQIVLCGLEGYSEFLDEKLRKKILEWQTPQGCYQSEADINYKRSSNIISYGCSDHTTGLGAAALALNMRFAIENNY